MMKNLSNETTRYMLDVIAYTLFTQNPLRSIPELETSARQIMFDYCLSEGFNADYTNIVFDPGESLFALSSEEDADTFED